MCKERQRGSMAAMNASHATQLDSSWRSIPTLSSSVHLFSGRYDLGQRTTSFRQLKTRRSVIIRELVIDVCGSYGRSLNSVLLSDPSRSVSRFISQRKIWLWPELNIKDTALRRLEQVRGCPKPRPRSTGCGGGCVLLAGCSPSVKESLHYWWQQLQSKSDQITAARMKGRFRQGGSNQIQETGKTERVRTNRRLCLPRPRLVVINLGRSILHFQDTALGKLKHSKGPVSCGNSLGL